MSRFTGSVFKKSRRYGFSILETGKEFSKGKKRTTAPGQHGARRSKLSGYGQQMQEKQKIKFMYGLNERQFRNTYAKAKKIAGITGTNFLQLLESHLLNSIKRKWLVHTFVYQNVKNWIKKSMKHLLLNDTIVWLNRNKAKISRPGDFFYVINLPLFQSDAICKHGRSKLKKQRPSRQPSPQTQSTVFANPNSY
jgi:hypothetical protein